MKVFDISVLVGNEYAELLNLWIDWPAQTCRNCGQAIPPIENYVRHIDVEWADGSDVIGDFVFALMGPIVVKSEIADELLQRFRGFVKGELRMPDHPNLRKPTRVTKRTPKRVWLPYEGPELCYIKITKDVPLLPLSTVNVESICDECGSIVYESFEGIERHDSREHVARTPGKGFFFDEDAVGDSDFFRPEFTGFTLCTDTARQFMLDRGYTNVEFLEVGDIIPPAATPP